MIDSTKMMFDYLAVFMFLVRQCKLSGRGSDEPILEGMQKVNDFGK